MVRLEGRRVVILAEGRFGSVSSKVASSYIRYCEKDCVAVVDSSKAGQKASDYLPYGDSIPIVDSISATLALKPDVLLIGVGLFNNELPASWRRFIVEALENGMDVVSGLHFRIATDPEFAMLASKHSRIIWDSKDPPAQMQTSNNRLISLNNYIVHTVGSDCRVGKKTTTLEITKVAQQKGYKAAMVATGQSGMYICGSGAAVDAVPSDFMSGVTEALVLEQAATHDWVVVEGQGSITHPAYSGVTLGLLHGAMPHALVLCHEAKLTHHKDWADNPLLPLPDLIGVYEQLAAYLRPAKVVAISVNCSALNREEAARYVELIEHETGLPATDVIYFGAEKLVAALERHCSSVGRQKVA